MKRTLSLTLLLLLAFLVTNSAVSCQKQSTSQTEPLKPTITENPHYIYENGAILVGGDGVPIELVDNPNATNPTYAKLLALIKEDSTDKHPYISSAEVATNSAEAPYVCSDFAEDLHNAAEAVGIRAAWVSIGFVGENEGHACNAFETTDKGLVYIDCTGGGLFNQLTFHLDEAEEGSSLQNSSSVSWDKVAYIETGREYGVIDIAKAGSLSYSFYEVYQQKCENFKQIIDEYNSEVIWFNREVSEYNKLLYDYNEEVEKYNSLYKGYMYLMSLPEELLRSTEFLDFQSRLHFGITFGELKKYLEEQSLVLKEQKEELNSRLESLEFSELRLQKKSEEIDKLRGELGDYSYESIGVVKDIHIYWGR